MKVQQFIDNLAAKGRYHFTFSEAQETLGGSYDSVRQALGRLKSKNKIARPYPEFFVILPSEYQALGCLPPEEFIPQLMAHLGKNYYVALLSAAAFHGAGHHRPQRFQVMLGKPQKRIKCGKTIVEFSVRKNLGIVPTVQKNTARGYVTISSPETTAFDLIGYPGKSGGFDNIANIFIELVEEKLIESEKLLELARLSPMPWVQRAGFVFEAVGAAHLTTALAEFVAEERPRICPLDPRVSMKDTQRDKKWRIAINHKIEPDI